MNERFQKAAVAYVKRVLSEKNWTATELARAANVSQTTITRPLNDTKGEYSFSWKTIHKVYQASNIEPPPFLTDIQTHRPAKEHLGNFDTGQLLKDLPIKGQAYGNNGNMLFTDDLVNTYTERPWHLLGRPEAYACYIYGESMVPAYRPGNLVYVDPSRPANIGDDVIVILANGEAMVKHLVRRKADSVIFEQHNPSKEIAIPTAEIDRIDRIVGVMKITV